MSGIVRDFSKESIAHLREIIKKNVEEEDQFCLFDWVEDFTMDELNVQDYINDIESYHAHMVDKHDMSYEEFNKILKRIYSVDINYSKRLKSIYDTIKVFNDKIVNVTEMISPEGITLKQDEYTELLNGVTKQYTDKYDELTNSIESDKSELKDNQEVLRDVPWYEKAGYFTTGALVEYTRIFALPSIKDPKAEDKPNAALKYF